MLLNVNDHFNFSCSDSCTNYHANICRTASFRWRDYPIKLFYISRRFTSIDILVFKRWEDIDEGASDIYDSSRFPNIVAYYYISYSLAFGRLYLCSWESGRHSKLHRLSISSWYICMYLVMFILSLFIHYIPVAHHYQAWFIIFIFSFYRVYKSL